MAECNESTAVMALFAMILIPLACWLVIMLGVIAFAPKSKHRGPPARGPTHPSAGYQPDRVVGEARPPPRHP